MKNKSNIIKFMAQRKFNIESLVILAFLILIGAQLYRFFTNSHPSIYEVREGSVNGEISVKAMIVREETVYNSEKAGYMNFYYREGARVSKGSKVYSLNDSQNLQDMLNLNEKNTVLSNDDLVRLKSDIRSFEAEYSDLNFAECYSMRETLLADYLRYRDLSMLDKVDQNSAQLSGFYTSFASQSGVISYFSDCYDGYTVSDVTGAEFDSERVVPERRKMTGISGTDSFAYKLVNDSSWKLVVEVSEEQMSRVLLNGPSIRFRIWGTKDIFEKSYETMQIGGKRFLIISMDRYAADFLDMRFVDVSLLLDVATGLKIPKTAIVEKELYQIPERFISKGNGEEDTLGVNVEYYDSQSGDVRVTFQEIEPLFFENGYYFVFSEALSSENFIDAPATDAEPERAMLYSFLTKMEGVYNMNKGYARFRRIVRMTDIDDYILVKQGAHGGVALYDHIILDVSAVSEKDIELGGDR